MDNVQRRRLYAAVRLAVRRQEELPYASQQWPPAACERLAELMYTEHGRLANLCLCYYRGAQPDALRAQYELMLQHHARELAETPRSE